MPRTRETAGEIARCSGMFSAMGNPARLRIIRLLLSAHPDGIVAGELQSELAIAPATLSHHLEKLKQQDLVASTREGTFLRYKVRLESLQGLLTFLYAECCTRNRAIAPEKIVQVCGRPPRSDSSKGKA